MLKSDLEDILGSPEKLQNRVTQLNRTRIKRGLSSLESSVLQREYELALAIEEAKEHIEETDYGPVASLTQELIAHQKEHGL